MLTYNGNDLFQINFNLYGEEFIKHKETLEAIKRGFDSTFREDLKRELKNLGLKYMKIETYSPKEYNFKGDSIDLVIETVDSKKYREALIENEEEINNLLMKNRSYDGYWARTRDNIFEEYKETERIDFEPDIICLSYLLTQKIDFKNNFNIYDYFEYDYSCGNDDCNNQKENYEEYLCEKCQKKEAEELFGKQNTTVIKEIEKEKEKLKKEINEKKNGFIETFNIKNPTKKEKDIFKAGNKSGEFEGLTKSINIIEKVKKEKPNGGGLRISREQAIYLIKHDLIVKGSEIMCYQYGADNCEDCGKECTCWTGINKDDIDEENEMDSLSDYNNFEIWI